MEKDLELKKWLEFHNRRYLVIATKTDKLKTQKERQHGMSAIRSNIGDGAAAVLGRHSAGERGKFGKRYRNITKNNPQ